MGQKIKPTGRDCSGGLYGKQCVVGDVIEMVLDLDAYTIKYKINDRDHGIMHQVEDSTCWLAFTSQFSNVMLEMLPPSTVKKHLGAGQCEYAICMQVCCSLVCRTKMFNYCEVLNYSALSIFCKHNW